MTKRFLILFLAVASTLLLSRGLRAADEHSSTPPAARDTATHAGGASSSGGAHGGAHEPLPLVPQNLDRQVQFQALWVVIIFIVLLVILYPTAWRSVLNGLKAREQRIRKDIADAEAARAKAEETLKQYAAQLQTAEDKVRDMIARASAEGEKIAASIKAHAQSESEEIKERAQRDIEASKNQALTEIYQQTATLATSIAEKILRKTLNAEDHRELVNQSLEQLQSTSKN